MPGTVPWNGPAHPLPPAWAAWAALGAAAAVVLLLTPPLRRVAWRTGFLDHPEARKQHMRATPLLGGVAVAAGALIGSGAVLSWQGMRFPAAAGWWGTGALAALLLGLVDDRFGMRPGPKLLFQVLVGTLFLLGGIDPGTGASPLLAAPLALLWIVALMNAVNFLDNMDGIVGGLSAILAIGLGLLLWSEARGAEALIAFALAGAALGFLRFNFPPASVFLGDAGSLFLGYALATLSLRVAEAGPGLRGVLAALIVLGYPLFDLGFVVVTRIREGRGIHVGGRDHTTHRLNRVVGGPRRTALVVYACALALTATGAWAARCHGLRGALLGIVLWAPALVAFGWRLARVPVAPAAAPPPDAPRGAS